MDDQYKTISFLLRPCYRKDKSHIACIIWMRIIRIYIFFCFGGMTMNAQHSTENLAIHHKVKDYALWRKGYDEHEKSRLSAGITNGKVFRSAEDPNDILILQDVADVAKLA